MDLRYAGGHAGESFEDTHWWMRSRFLLLDRAMRKFRSTPAVRVLEVGCGTGVNLRYLAKHYRSRLATLTGVDPFAEEITQDTISIRRDLGPEKFDLVLLMDVLEHVEEPDKLLKEIRERLLPEGWLLVTVPAFQWLWTRYDEMINHKKRFSSPELRSILQRNGYGVHELFFLFAALFPFFVLQRLCMRFLRLNPRAFKPMHPLINSLLFAITWVEVRFWMPCNRWFGSSIVALATAEAPARLPAADYAL